MIEESGYLVHCMHQRSVLDHCRISLPEARYHAIAYTGVRYDLLALSPFWWGASTVRTLDLESGSIVRSTQCDGVCWRGQRTEVYRDW